MRGDVDGHRLSVYIIILVGIRRAVSDRLDKRLMRGCFLDRMPE